METKSDLFEYTLDATRKPPLFLTTEIKLQKLDGFTCYKTIEFTCNWVDNFGKNALKYPATCTKHWVYLEGLIQMHANKTIGMATRTG